ADWKRFEQDRVNQSEDGGVRSDAEGDGEDDGGDEPGRFSNLAECKFEVVHRFTRYGREGGGRVSREAERSWGFLGGEASGRIGRKDKQGPPFGRNDKLARGAGLYEQREIRRGKSDKKKPPACARGFFRGRDL